MGLTNKGFETAGLTPGSALGWTVTVFGQAVTMPDFSGGVGLPIPTETFERGWSNDAYLWFFAPGDVSLGSFNTGLNTSPFESFEVEWSNDGFLFFLGATFGANFSGNPYEGFEVGWGNDSYLFLFGPGDTTLGTGPETFESGWDNDTYLLDLSTTGVTIASFDGPAAQVVEDFEEVSPPRTFTVDLANQLFLCANHGFPDDEPVMVKGPGLPGGFAGGILYYIYNPANHPDDFKLADAPSMFSGTPVPPTTAGSGTVFGDPARFWNSVV